MAGETCTTSMCWTFGQLCITSVKAYYRATRPKSQLVNTRRHETADHPVKVGEFGSRRLIPMKTIRYRTETLWLRLYSAISAIDSI